MTNDDYKYVYGHCDYTYYCSVSRIPLFICFIHVPPRIAKVDAANVIA